MSTINLHEPWWGVSLSTAVKQANGFSDDNTPSLGKFFDDTCTQAQIEGIHKFIEEKAEQLTLELMAEYHAALQKPIDDYDNAMRMFDK